MCKAQICKDQYGVLEMKILLCSEDWDWCAQDTFFTLPLPCSTTYTKWDSSASQRLTCATKNAHLLLALLRNTHGTPQLCKAVTDMHNKQCPTLPSLTPQCIRKGDAVQGSDWLAQETMPVFRFSCSATCTQSWQLIKMWPTCTAIHQYRLGLCIHFHLLNLYLQGVPREATGKLLKTINDMHIDTKSGLCQVCVALQRLPVLIYSVSNRRWTNQTCDTNEYQSVGAKQLKAHQTDRSAQVKPKILQCTTHEFYRALWV